MLYDRGGSLMPQGFEEFFKHLDSYPKSMEKNMDKALRRSAEILRTNLIKGIHSQRWSSSWPALSTKYLEQKEARGDNTNILISGYRAPSSRVPTEHYVQSFAVQKRKKLSYAVGTNYPQARALEYGFEARGLPARPHLAPALQDSEEAIKAELSRGFKDSLGVRR